MGDRVKKTTLFLTLISLFFLLAANYDEKVSLQDSYYSRNGIYERPFDMWYADTSLCQMYIEKTIPKEKAETISQTILDNMKILNERFYRKSDILIYLIDDQAIDYPYRIGNSVVITYTAFEKENYIEAILSAYFSCNEEWMLRGVKELIYGSPVDTAELKGYYNRESKMKDLHLNPWTFSRQFNTRDLKTIESTAARLVKFIDESYGRKKLYTLFETPRKIEEVLGVSYTELKNEWLKSIGCVRVYSYEYDNFFDGFFCIEKENYLSIIGKDVRYDIYKEIFDSTDDLDLFLYRNITGREKTVELIKEHSKDAKNIRLNIDIHYLIMRIDNKLALISWMNSLGQSLLDSEPNAHVHEAVHLYIASYLSPISEIWLHEGMCEYFDILYGEYDKELNYDTLNAIGNIEGTFFGEVRKEYIRRGGNLSSLSEFDYPLYIDVLAYISFLYPTVANQYYIDFESVYDIKMDEYKNLTYPQAASLVSYMVNTYSLSDVLTICGSFNKFESVTGKSFNEVYIDWRNYIEG